MRTTLLALSLSVIGAGSALAQLTPETTQVLPRSQRLGTFTSASVLIPSDSAFTQVVVDTDMATVDLINPDTDIRYMVQVSDDDGATWRNYAGGHYVGCDCPSRDGSPQKQPGVEAPVSDFRGLRVRMTLDITGTVRTGAKVTQR
jgi:hypothetical protein